MHTVNVKYVTAGTDAAAIVQLVVGNAAADTMISWRDAERVRRVGREHLGDVADIYARRLTRKFPARTEQMVEDVRARVVEVFRKLGEEPRVLRIADGLG